MRFLTKVFNVFKLFFLRHLRWGAISWSVYGWPVFEDCLLCASEARAYPLSETLCGAPL